MDPTITVNEFVSIVQAWLPEVSKKDAEGLLLMFESLGYTIKIED